MLLLILPGTYGQIHRFVHFLPTALAALYEQRS